MSIPHYVMTIINNQMWILIIVLQYLIKIMVFVIF